MILNHISLGTTNVERAVNFYDSVLASLSIQRSHYIEGVAAAYGEQFEFWVGAPCEGKATASNGAHVAFNAPSRASVDAFYNTALEMGATCEGKPGPRPEYGETYYAAFVRDLDGNKIEAVAI
ncbi:VOC family protein [Vibrio sinaloensis]|uniref:VOC family protein n=1 Tax=Photobacterium sp. (strain ATCC 43367) TaxID=379097 RepID=UPI0035E9B381